MFIDAHGYFLALLLSQLQCSFRVFTGLYLKGYTEDSRTPYWKLQFSVIKL